MRKRALIAASLVGILVLLVLTGALLVKNSGQRYELPLYTTRMHTEIPGVVVKDDSTYYGVFWHPPFLQFVRHGHSIRHVIHATNMDLTRRTSR